jgi:hypothetical protein
VADDCSTGVVVKPGYLIPLTVLVLAAQTTAPVVDYVCPMDPDVRAKGPGKCPRCGMALEAGIQQPVQYKINVTSRPVNVPVGKPVELRFELLDPKTNQRATKFELVHEKLFHLFLVSADLETFVHDHPVPEPDGTFRYQTTLKKPGIYRLLADCYPTGGTPQLLPHYLTTAGYDKSIQESVGHPVRDLTPKQAQNISVSLRMDPPEPLPGRKTLMFFTISPGDGLEQYLGAWGHMLAAGTDLIDAIHEHPIYADGKPEVQFNVFFPRAGMYRVWVQFQRNGVVNTAAFTVPVSEPRS